MNHYPRGFADENQVVNNLTHGGRTSRGFWLSGYKSNNHNVEYLSLKEHQTIVAELETKQKTQNEKVGKILEKVKADLNILKVAVNDKVNDPGATNFVTKMIDILRFD